MKVLAVMSYKNHEKFDLLYFGQDLYCKVLLVLFVLGLDLFDLAHLSILPWGFSFLPHSGSLL